MNALLPVYTERLQLACEIVIGAILHHPIERQTEIPREPPWAAIEYICRHKLREGTSLEEVPVAIFWQKWGKTPGRFQFAGVHDRKVRLENSAGFFVVLVGDSDAGPAYFLEGAENAATAGALGILALSPRLQFLKEELDAIEDCDMIHWFLVTHALRSRADHIEKHSRKVRSLPYGSRYAPHSVLLDSENLKGPLVTFAPKNR